MKTGDEEQEMNVTGRSDEGMFERVTLYPWLMDRSARLKFKLGAFRENGSFLEQIRLERNRVLSDDRVMDDSIPVEEWPGEHVYGGILFGHYGHFLLESLSRVSAFRPGVPIVWHVARADADNHKKLFPWQQAVFEVLDIDTSTFRMVTKDAVCVERLAISRPGYVIPDAASTEHMRRLACFRASTVVPGRKIWLSRSKLVDLKRKYQGEEELERRLVAEGWEIYSPERHSVLAQLRHMTSAEILAGFMGSAFHTLILAQGVGTRLAIVTKGGDGNRNYTTIAEAMSLKQEIISTPMETISKGGLRQQYKLKSVDALFAALQITATSARYRDVA